MRKCIYFLKTVFMKKKFFYLNKTKSNMCKHMFILFKKGFITPFIKKKFTYSRECYGDTDITQFSCFALFFHFGA